MPRNILWIQSLLGVAQESPVLEFKGSGALAWGNDKDKNVAELVKDVTAMANAGGGTIVYGVSEGADATAAAIDPVTEARSSADWMGNILTSNTMPPFSALRIETIAVDGGRVLVLDIEQASTAHQSLKDRKYYQRQGAKAEPMIDFQIRDVMNRRSGPVIDVRLDVLADAGNDGNAHRYTLVPTFNNVGNLTLERWLLEILLPRQAYDAGRMAAIIMSNAVVDEVLSERRLHKRIRIGSHFAGTEHAVHPGQILHLDPTIGITHCRLLVNDDNHRHLQGMPIKWTLFSPNAKPLEGEIQFDEWCRF